MRGHGRRRRSGVPFRRLARAPTEPAARAAAARAVPSGGRRPSRARPSPARALAPQPRAAAARSRRRRRAGMGRGRAWPRRRRSRASPHNQSMAERKAAEDVREQERAAGPGPQANGGGVNILFVGDVVGGIGRRTLLESLPILRERYAPTFVVVNAENSAGGLGITPKIADVLLAAGVDEL